jgi:predicted nucleotidyltransferase
MAEYKDLVSRVVTALEASTISYVIVGGFAAIFRGVPRTTTDLDVIIENDPVKIESFLQELKKNGFDVMEQQTRLALAEGSDFSIFDYQSPLRVDLKIATKQVDRIALKKGLPEEYEGMKICLASPELILFGKVLYTGDISMESDADLLEFNDVRDFINVFTQSGGIDMDWLTGMAAKHGLTKTLDRLLDIAKNEPKA